MNYSTILLKRNFISIPENFSADNLSDAEFITIINNFSYYGYMLSLESLNTLKKLDRNTAISFIKETIEGLKVVTSEDKNMGDFVVYKNFPKEVLNMSDDVYWIKQILMYIGFDKSIFTEEVEARNDCLDEIKKYKVLSNVKSDFYHTIMNDLISTSNSWSEDQEETANFIYNEFSFNVDLNLFNFKLNGLKLILNNIEKNKNFKIVNATDVLRLAVLMSGGNPMLKNYTLKSFKRPERRFLLELLNNTNNLVADIFLNKKVWKTFLRLLHPNDYNFKNVIEAQDIVYNNKYKTFNSSLESLIQNKDPAVFNLIKSRSGLFSNMLYSLYSIFGVQSFKEFITVIDQVDTKKLLKLKVFFNHVNDRKKSIYSAPLKKMIKVDFNQIKLSKKEINQTIDLNTSVELLKDKFNQSSIKEETFLNNESEEFIKKDKVIVKKSDLKLLLSAIDAELKFRLLDKLGHDVFVDENTKFIKIKDNDSSLNNFGKGTVFHIPENINFIRTASLWKKNNSSSHWIDNSINFYDKNFNILEACCWNSHRNTYAAFSGDPVINNSEPTACQMVDIYINDALKNNARYAVWSALSYNNINFSEYDDSVLNVQFGEEKQDGQLFEPSRSVISFHLANQNVKNKVMAVFDLELRTVTFLDQTIPNLSVRSATENCKQIKDFLVYNFENIQNSPSLHDLLSVIHNDKSENKVIYSDKDITLNKDKKHFVFLTENQENNTELYNLESFI